MIGIGEEMRRIWAGPSDEERDQPRLLIRMVFDADEPLEVLETARKALSAVLQQVEAWPADEAWSALLPSAFVARCAPELPEPENDVGPELIAEWEHRWKSLPMEEKLALAEGPWTLSDWLYYFDPSDDGRGHDRHWWWWDAGVDVPGQGWVKVATTGWPFEAGSLYWLIEASGGRDPHY